MYAIGSLLLIVAVSLVVTRVATVMLTATGLSREVARFQARSAFTGTGFTTEESERIVRHPVRRRIVMLLMLLGNAGIVTAVASLMLTFVDTRSALGSGVKAAAIALGVGALWALSMSAWVERRLSPLIAWALKRYTHLDVQDYAGLMHLAGEYQIAELRVAAEDWIAGKELREARLREEGLLVLGIERPDGSYLGAPLPSTEIRADDLLLIYGRASALKALDERRRDARGDREHRRAVEAQRDIAAREGAVGAPGSDNRQARRSLDDRNLT